MLPSAGAVFTTGRPRRWPVVIISAAIAAVAAVFLTVLVAWLFPLQPPALRLPRYGISPERTVGPRTLHHVAPPLTGPRVLVGAVALAALLAGIGVANARTRGRRSASRSHRRAAHRAGRWWPALAVAGVVILVFAVAVRDFVEGLPPATGNRDDGPSAFGPETGSIVDVARGTPRSVRPRPGMIALTFDDGPDPRWTPAILDVLAREHVPATFFVIGSQVVRHPGIVYRAAEAGNEIGIHTYRHREIAGQDPDATARELGLTQLAVVGATGRTTSLFRPPFITRTSEVGLARYVALRDAGREGYVTVLADQHPSDWKQPTAAAIVRRSVPGSRFYGSIVELHDGGGDRTHTLAALPVLIHRLRAGGYTFGTVSEVAGLPGARTMQPAPLGTRLWGWWFVRAMRLSTYLADGLLALGALAVGLSLLRIGFVIVLSRRSRHTQVGEATPLGAPVTVLIAAYDEAPVIGATLRALVAGTDPGLRVLVVDDGSTDGTVDAVRAVEDPRIELLVLPHGGKAAALQEGLRHVTTEIVVTVDADTRLAPDALAHLVAPFVDRRVAAVAGNVRVDDPSSVLTGVQDLEYVMGNRLDRGALDALGIQVTVPGAAAAFRRRALEAVGGFSGATVAEDTDVTLALVVAGWRARFAPGAVAVTSVPRTLRALWRQRSRWSYGILQSVARNRAAALRWGDARATGAWWFLALTQVVLPLLTPLLDLVALWSLLHGGIVPVIAWLGFVTVFFGAALLAQTAEGAEPGSLAKFPLQFLGHRQLVAAATWQAVAWAVAGRLARWGTRVRVGADAGSRSDTAPGGVDVTGPDTGPDTGYSTAA